SGLTWHSTLVYLDDIIIYSSTFEDHLQHLNEVFQRLRSAELVAKLSKCEFCCPELVFLGHTVSARGVAPDPSKISAIQALKQPTDITTLRKFLGLTGYYRRFVNNYSKIGAPLFKLLKKNIPFKWEHAQEEAFKQLKENLTSAPILGYPNFKKLFQL